MTELLENFSLSQIVFYAIILFVALKELVDFVSWWLEKYRDRFDISYNKKRDKEILEERLSGYDSQINNLLNQVQKLDIKLDKIDRNFNSSIESIQGQVSLLIDSDKNDIKSWMVEKHHDFMTKGQIDDYSMNVIELRFQNYREEGGNSYVKSLVEDLRKLNKQSLNAE